MDVGLLYDASYHKAVIAGYPVISEGGQRQFYIVIAGQVDAYSRAAVRVASFAAGGAFGLHAFFCGEDDTTYIAAKDSVLFVVPERRFEELASAHPRVLYGLLEDAYAKLGVPTQDSKQLLVINEKAGQLAVVAGELGKIETEQPAEPMETVLLLGKAAADIGAFKEETFKVVDTTDAQPPVEKSSVLPLREPNTGNALPSIFPKGHKSYPGVIRPEYKKFLFAKEIVCPNCGKTFKSQKVFMSKLVTAKPMRFDLRQYYEGFQMEWYEVVTCPSCYFSALINLFTEPKNLSRSVIRGDLINTSNEMALDFEAERDIDFVLASHYLALSCSRAFMNYRQINAKLWSNISWMYEDVEDTEMAAFAARKAAEANEIMYLESSLNPAQEQMVSLAVAGMLYRAGEAQQARKWLFQVKNNMMGKRLYVDLADDLMDILRSEMATNQIG